MSAKKTGSQKISGIKKTNLLITIVLLLLVTYGCAAQHKYKKIRAVPCPCEKENRR